MSNCWIHIVEEEDKEKAYVSKNDILIVVSKEFSPAAINLTILTSLKEKPVFEGLEFYGVHLSMKVMRNPIPFRNLKIRANKNIMAVRFHGLPRMTKPMAWTYVDSWHKVFTPLYFEMLDANNNVQYYWKRGYPTNFLPPLVDNSKLFN